MKFFKHIAFGLSALALLASCSEDDTLDGAKEVYIEITPSEISLAVGDTLQVSARVTNLSGKTINTPIEWSIDATDIAQVETRETDGATVVTAIEGAQGKTTKLRATLLNGKYAVSTVTITTHSPQSVVPEQESTRMYRISDALESDTVWFFVEPYSIINDFTPSFAIAKTEGYEDAPATLDATDAPLVYDPDLHRVGVAVYPSRSHGSFDVSLTVGGAGETATGTCTVSISPSVKVGMWDPDISGMTAPTGDQFYGFNYEVRKTVDVNTEVKIYARVLVDGGRSQDIENARGCYSWEVESGNNTLIVGQDEVDNEYGYDAVLTLRTGISSGETVICFNSPDTAATTMKAYITVKNFDKDYPVNDIVVTPTASGMTLDNLSVTVGGNLELTVSTDPLTSLAYHRPEVSVADPSVLSYESYEGTLMLFRGLKPGTTKVTLTSMSITKTLNVTVTDEVSEILWASAPTSMAAGQSETFQVKVRTASGSTSSYPVTWKSSDTSVLTVTPASDSSKATVKALKDGTATITATVTGAGKTLSISQTVNVVSGYADINVSDCGYYMDGNKAGFWFTAGGYDSVWLYTKNVLLSLSGSLMASDFSGADFNGTSASITASTLTIDSNNVANGTVTVSLGGVPLKVVFNNVSIDYDI
jgi:hypothetical protein